MNHCQKFLTVLQQRSSAFLTWSMLAMICLHAGSAMAIDCNQNGQDDDLDLLAGTSQDCNGNSIPDECEAPVLQRLLGEVPFLSTALPADVDDDGDLDLIVTSLIGLYWQENVHVDSLMVTHILSNDNSPARSLRAADMNHDGHTDILADLGSSIRIFRGNGAHPPQFTVQSVPSSLGAIDVLTVTDLDQDGDLDLVAADSNDDVICLLRQASGVYSEQLVSGIGVGITAIAAGNFNGDAHQDLVLTLYEDDTILALLGTGQPGAPYNQLALSQSVGGPLDLKLVDLDQDQDLDVVVAAFGDEEIVLLRNPGGPLPVMQRQTLDSGAAGVWSVDVADMDGDGDMDLLSAHKLSHSIWMYSSSGGSQPVFLPQVIAEGILFAEEVYHGDTNSDGLLDIVVPSRSQHEVFGFSNFVIDCNNNGVADWCDITDGTSLDCNGNGRPDECENDCNGNGQPDMCDILAGTSLDLNSNGQPDECEKPEPPQLQLSLLPSGDILLQWEPVLIANRYRILMTSTSDTVQIFGETSGTSFQIGPPYTEPGFKFSLQVVAISEQP
ncbi:MAG: VCBS repeat-containing protein [Candidatus Cloacimonetes bacterium]|nr:VCBS repeat-containing protein [Candidatus Cloacimonadota bacterium]